MIALNKKLAFIMHIGEKQKIVINLTLRDQRDHL